MGDNGRREVLLEDVAAEITVGHVGPMASEYVLAGIPFLRSQNVEPFLINFQDIKYITDDFHERLKKSALVPGDVVIVRTGRPGAAAVIPGSLQTANCSDLVIVRPGPLLDARFLSYYVNSAAAHHISSHLVGAVQQHFNVGSARKMRLWLPPLPEQRAIAHILGTLDDKIELNRRMNDTLEAMARALFKSWFVDFDPVRAKAEGRDTGLPKRIADLFPDRFHESELGEIPDGWKACTWGDLVTLEYGRSLRGYASADESYPVYGTNGRIGTHSEPLCSHPGIIIGRKGAYRGVHFCDSPFFVIDTAFYIKPIVPLEMRWAYYVILGHDINAMDSGSAIPSTSREDFYSLLVTAPPFEIQQHFVEVLKPFWARQDHNQKESVTLAAIRDALLPKLLSGEIRVKDLEKFLEVHP